MSRLVVDRLWPMLLVLSGLLAGAVVLQQWAGRRGNETVRILIHDESAASEEDDSTAPADAGGAEAGPVSEVHARARLAARRAQFKEALPLFEQALAEHPNAPVLEGELGYWLLVSGDPRKALPHLQRADALRPGAQTAVRLGLALARLGDRDGSERELRRALKLRPGYGPALIALGGLLRKKGAVAEAIAMLEAAARTGSNTERARSLVALGAAYLDAGRRADADRAFDEAIRFSPARAEVRLGIARAYLAGEGKEDVSRAVQIALRTSELAPDVPAVYTTLGRARERLGDAAAAREAYDRALRLDPGYRYARQRLLRLALQDRDFPRARHEADRLLADGPSVPEHHFLAALVADKEGRRDDARKEYAQAIAAAGGDYPEAFLNLGVLEKGAGDLAAAREAYAKALKLRPGYAAAWLNLAKLHEASSDSAAAEAAYRKALEIDPRYAAAWLALGQLHSEQKRWPEAIAELSKALEVKPGYAAALLSMGVAYARAGRLGEAVETYRALLAEEPRHVAAWYDLALALEQLEKPAEARQALENAISIDASHVASLRELAGLDLRERRLGEAKRGYEDLLDLSPGDVGARSALAELAALQGDPKSCQERARILLEEAPRDPEVQGLAARCAAGTHAEQQ